MSKPYWIWSRSEPSLEKEVCFFRRVFELETVPAHCEVQISADSIYRFHVNGTLVARGPQKSDRYRRYYETVDIAPLLRPGKNVLAAMVCHFINDEENSRIFETGPISVLCTLRGGFLLMCGSLEIATGREWRVLSSNSVQFASPYLSRYATDMLRVSLRNYPAGFEELDFDDSAFQIPALVADTAFEHDSGVTLWPLTPANLPMMSETPVAPQAVKRSSHPGTEALLNGGSFTFPAGQAAFVELDMGCLTTAHLSLDVGYNSDKPVQLTLTYAESYFRQDGENGLYKGLRDDAENAVFAGESDVCELRNNYENTKKLKFETVFFRTFRFLRLDLGCLPYPVTLGGLAVTEVKYPLEIQAVCDEQGFSKQLWDVSVRTLRLCMHATYEDCPYYEQMQYTMDTALQMKYTYQLSTDDRLARNAIDAFSASRMPDGLVTCNYPAKFTQVIPGFALYFIEMLYDHYWYFGDKKLLRRYLHVVDSVLQFFLQKLGENGLFPRSPYWEFVDWVPQWHHNFGVPIGKQEEINTIYHEMLVYFLKKAASLNEALGFPGVAAEYLAAAEKVGAAVREFCFDAERGLFTDTVGRPDTSAHAQFWAVLSGIAQGGQAKGLMERVLADQSLAQSSYSMNFYLFRALEQVGMYGESARYLAQWASMLDNHMTTWCEDPVTQRSDCHGWSSLPIYEYCRMTLGVSPSLPGYRAVRVAPFTGSTNAASGTVATCRGPVRVSWQRGSGFFLEVDSPAGVPVEIQWDGKSYISPGGSFRIE